MMSMIKKVGMLWRVEYVLARTGEVRTQTYRTAEDAERYVDQLLQATEQPDHGILEIRSCPIHVYEQKGQERVRYVQPIK